MLNERHGQEFRGFQWYVIKHRSRKYIVKIPVRSKSKVEQNHGEMMI